MITVPLALGVLAEVLGPERRSEDAGKTTGYRLGVVMDFDLGAVEKWLREVVAGLAVHLGCQRIAENVE